MAKRVTNSNLIKLNKSLDKEKYKVFLKMIGDLKSLKDIKIRLQNERWDEKEVERYYSFMSLTADSKKKLYRPKKSHTKAQKLKIKKLSARNKGKKFDNRGKQIESVTILSGGSTGLSKK